MKALEIITVVPGTLYFASEVEILLNNLTKFGYSADLTVLVEKESAIKYQEYWDKLAFRYSEARIFFYSTNGARNLKQIYSPVIRPNILKQHFEKYPSLKDKAIFYIDSDVILTKKLDFTPFLENDVTYCSKTDYISAKYFDSKDKDVLPNRIKQFSDIDVLDDACKLIGITRKIAELNQENTGGCQYLLKNIDYKFWEKVEQDCVTLRIQLQNVNHLYFSSEQAGFQSWCADMLAILWNLWLRGDKTVCPKEFDFSWATQTSDKWKKTSIYHNAGVTGKYQKIDGREVKMYNKSELIFRENILTPFDIDFTDIDPNYCDFLYVQEILSVINPICKSNKYIY